MRRARRRLSSATTVTYTVTNSGTGNLTIATATSSAASNVTVNSIGAPGSTTVASGGDTTTFAVQYTPTLAGAFSFGLSFVNDDGNENPYNFTVSGTATGTPEISVSADIGGAVADSGTNAQGTQTAGSATTVTYTVTNSGTDDLTIATATSSAASNVTVNSIGAPGSTTITGGGGITTFTVQYTPTLAGAFSFGLSFVNDDGDETPYNFTVSGIATGTPEIEVSADIGGAVTDGGTNAQGTQTAGSATTVTYTVTNSGTDDLTIATATSSAASNVTVNSIGAPGSTTITGGGGITTFTVQYTPTLAGAFSFGLSFVNDDGDETPYNFTVSGTATGTPEISIQGNSVSIGDGDTTPSATDDTDFGDVAVAGGSNANTFTIQNTGTSDLSLTSVSSSDNTQFAVSGTTGGTISAGGSVTFTVTFDPGSAGTHGATITVVSDDSDEGTYTFSVEGVGTVPEINIQGNSVSIVNGDTTPSATDDTDFGDVAVAGGSNANTFTIQNTGTSDLSLTSVSSSDNTQFAVSGTTGGTISASGSATFTVTFDPGSAGTHGATITVVSDDADEGTYTFSVEGVGTVPEINIQGNSVSIVNGDTTPSATDDTDFGDVAVAGGSNANTFTIQNTGTGSLSLTSVSSSDNTQFAVSGTTSGTIAASGSATFTVTFDPGSAGTHGATITVVSDDSDEGTYTFSVEGVGTVPEINIQGNSVSIVNGDTTPSVTDDTDFGDVAVA